MNEIQIFDEDSTIEIKANAKDGKEEYRPDTNERKNDENERWNARLMSC